MDNNKKISILNIVFKNTGTLLRDGVNFTINCPKCKDSRKEKKKLTIRLDNGVYHCWVCELKGKNIFRFIYKNYPSYINIIPSELLDIHNFDYSHNNDLENKVELPENFQFILNKTSDPDILAVRKYLISRGLTIEQIYRWRILATKSGSYRRTAIFPSFDCNGDLNYCVARYIDNNVKFKYKNSLVKKTKVIFNDIDIDWNKTIYIVEGIFDAINSPENTIPILGSSISEDSILFSKIVKNKSNIVLALDPDLKRKTYFLAEKLYKMDCNVNICFAPDGKDFGQLTKDEVKTILNNSKEYNPIDSIKFKISNIKSGSLI